MSKFTVKEFEELDQDNVKLLLVNGISLYHEFENEILRDGNIKRQLKIILRRLLHFSQGHRLPEWHAKVLKNDKYDPYPDFEIKTDNLRLYGFFDAENNIVVLGGKKNTQDLDIVRMRKIKLEFFKDK